MPLPDWMGATPAKRRRDTSSAVELVAQDKNTPLAHDDPVDEDGASDRSVDEVVNDCDSSSVGTDTSDTDLTNWRRRRGLPIAHKGNGQSKS